MDLMALFTQPTQKVPSQKHKPKESIEEDEELRVQNVSETASLTNGSQREGFFDSQNLEKKRGDNNKIAKKSAPQQPPSYKVT